MRYIPEFATIIASCVIIVTASLGGHIYRYEYIACASAAAGWALLSAVYRKTAQR